MLPAAFAVLVSLLASLLTLAGASPARATDPECAPLALAPFGDPGDAVGRVTVQPGSSACFTFAADAPGMYMVASGDHFGSTAGVSAPDGTEVECEDGDGHELCALPAAGTYTLKLVNYNMGEAHEAYTVIPLASTRGCADSLDTRWDQPDEARTTTGPHQIDCLPIEAKPGERVRFTYGSRYYGASTAWITDGTGEQICPSPPEGAEGCVLPGDGPYRVISRVLEVERGFPAEYGVKVRRLNDPQGCTVAPVRPFGPLERQDFVTNPCYTFTADAAGVYTVNFLEADGSTGAVQVYDSDGGLVCESTAHWCRVPTAGTYTAVLDGLYPNAGYPFFNFPKGLVVVDRASDAGCVPAEAGLYSGELITAGQYDCLKLDLPQGAVIGALTPLAASGVDAAVDIVDRTGALQCTAERLSAGTCALTGTAPYRALVHADEYSKKDTGPYALAFHRTDGAGGCPVLPAGSFSADGAQATLTTGDGAFSHCLSIPADAHTGAEVFQLVSTAAGIPAQFSVLDSTGKQVCERMATANGWTVCPLAPGEAHTVLVTGRNSADTYALTRRDVTATASSAGCTPIDAAKVGGPSVPGSYGAPGTLNCHQITTGAATDVVHIDVRDALGTANIAVFGGDGTSECALRNRSCAATGSTAHQVLVQTPSHLKAAPEYRLDALRIATANGPAPECVRVPSIAYGHGPLTGTLDESHTAVCAVLPTAGYDRFGVEITDTTGASATAVPALYNDAWRNGCTSYGLSDWQCAVNGSSSAASPSVFVLGLPEKAAGTSYSAKLTCAYAPCGPERVKITTVSPDTGVAGGKAAFTVTGTALPADATVRLRRNGATLTATTDAVSADHRTLTAALDLTGAAPGAWSLSVVAGGVEYLRGTFTVTAPQMTNTAAPVITGTAKVGAKVTATSGSWSVTPSSYTYEWQADGQTIVGETASSYTIPPSVLGMRLSVVVTAVSGGRSSASAASAAVTVVKGDAPRATVPPVISGPVKVGRTVKTSNGTWNQAGASYTYQWYANGQAILGARTSSYTVPAGSLGRKLSVVVTTVRSGWLNGSAASAAVTVAKGDAPRATVLPVISGPVKVGRTVKTSNGTWSPAGTSYTYQWYANGRAITGATRSSLVLKAAQRGTRITVKVIARRAGHTDGSAVSRATGPVTR
ncbi:Tat pathway signal protein [Streptomyces sp. NPDC006172]|uniref:Tat pathway signal protein n=1 Tax=Streptomyces sp. NPDC006172 TaxID=3154470 RepID=UPI0033EC4479